MLYTHAKHTGALLLFVLVSGYVCQIKLYTRLSSPR